MDTQEVDVFTIDDRDYYVLEEVKHGTCTYYFLSAVDDERKMMVWKTEESAPDKIGPLDSREELQLACSLFQRMPHKF